MKEKQGAKMKAKTSKLKRKCKSVGTTTVIEKKKKRQRGLRRKKRKTT